MRSKIESLVTVGNSDISKFSQQSLSMPQSVTKQMSKKRKIFPKKRELNLEQEPKNRLKFTSRTKVTPLIKINNEIEIIKEKNRKKNF